jgi:hypothetical protein
MKAETAHRHSEVARLTELLREEAPGLRIVGVSGPGGVGKSYLLNHVLDAVNLTSERWLRLSVDGSNEQARRDFFGLIDGQLARRGLPAPAKAKHDYFPHVRNVASIHRSLIDAASAELSASGAPVAVKVAAIALLQAGRHLNKTLPVSRRLVDLRDIPMGSGELGQTIDEVWDVVRKLNALRDSSSLPGVIRDALGMTYKARVKNDLYNVTADALVTDIAAALSGYLKKDRWLLTQARIQGLERLLLIIDDFEALAPILEEFLVGALIPRLAAAPFPTLLLILGRDELEAMHPAWGQHCRNHMRGSIRLSPFNRETAMDLLANAGVPEARREELYRATQGFPFLLSLLIEELGAEGDSALFLRKFFDRTTRWMSAREREWLSRVCYLDRVNIDSLKPLFPGEDVEEIQDWFEREASIRDPASAVFRVRPLIREKVLRYQELRSPSRHRELSELSGMGVMASDQTPG